MSEWDKFIPFTQYCILVINTQLPLCPQSYVITRIPYSFWAITNTYTHNNNLL